MLSTAAVRFAGKSGDETAAVESMPARIGT
jgi:hypothetical protein